MCECVWMSGCVHERTCVHNVRVLVCVCVCVCVCGWVGVSMSNVFVCIYMWQL